MQTKFEEERPTTQAEETKESLYRTKWLMAHNHLHTVVHEPSCSPAKEWDDYLRELETAGTVAKNPA
jgi:hypothetical protein